MAAHGESPAPTGFFISNNNFKKDYIVYPDTHPGRIRDYIDAKNPNAASYSQELAFDILDVSSCLEIDPVYMTVLIRKESTFYPRAVSPTGAVGLTQMTGVAIQELRDQMGLRGKGHSRASNTRYLKRTLKRCMGTSRFARFIRTLSSSDASIKKEIKDDSLLGLYMGGMILKVYLTNAKDKNRNADKESLYRAALRQYNGDVNRRKYAEAIIHYAREFDTRY